MKYNSLFFLFIIGTLSACNTTQNSKSDTQITVYLKDTDTSCFTNNYLYLYDYGEEKIVDSGLIQNTAVTFTCKSVNASNPRRVSIQILDSNQGRKYYRPIGFKHPFVPNVSLHIFFIDTGITYIETYTSKFHPINSTTLFSGSAQNTPYFKNVYLNYPDTNTSDRNKISRANIEQIQRWPNSYFFLEQLFTYRNYFTSEELDAQLGSFSNTIKKSTKFQLLTQFSTKKNSFDNTYPASIKLRTPNGDFRTMREPTTAATLIVFWASWCGPCRKEIPLLKKLYAQHKGNGLEIVSISMDANETNWQMALTQEQMHWTQLLLTDSSKEFVKINYELSAIPKSYLFDKNGTLVERFLGLEDTAKMYETIEKVLK